MKKRSTFSIIALAVIGILLSCNIIFAADTVKTSEATIKTSAYDWASKNAIENKLRQIDGVKEAVVNLDEKLITATYDSKKVSAETLVYAVIELGYEAQVVAVKEQSGINAYEIRRMTN